MKSKTPKLTPAQIAQVLGDPADQKSTSNNPVFPPERLVSLLDMLIFTLGELAPWRILEHEEERINRRIKDSPGALVTDKEFNGLMGIFHGVEQFCDKFCLPSSRRQNRIVSNQVKVYFPKLTGDAAWHLLENLHVTMREELHARKLICVKDDSARYLADKTIFGVEVHAKFKQIDHHAAAAGACYACEQWTASVFHSMLVVEVGLRYVAKRLHVKTVRGNLPIEYGTWGDITMACQAAIKSLTGHSKSTMAKKDQYKIIIDRCERICGLWRNPVFHGRKTCKQQEAFDVLSDSISFMEAIAAIKRH